MTDAALMLNGLYAGKLDTMIAAQLKAPDETFYVQPHSTSPIAGFLPRGPLVDPPTVLYASTTTNLAAVSYRADIVCWRDKTLMDPDGEEFKGIDASIRRWKYKGLIWKSHIDDLTPHFRPLCHSLRELS